MAQAQLSLDRRFLELLGRLPVPFFNICKPNGNGDDTPEPKRVRGKANDPQCLDLDGDNSPGRMGVKTPTKVKRLRCVYVCMYGQYVYSIRMQASPLFSHTHLQVPTGRAQ